MVNGPTPELRRKRAGGVEDLHPDAARGGDREVGRVADAAAEAAVGVALEGVAHGIGDGTLDLRRHRPRRLTGRRARQRAGIAVDLRDPVHRQADVELLGVHLAAGDDRRRRAEAPQHRAAGVDGAAGVGDTAREAGAEGAAGEQRARRREDHAHAVDERHAAVDEDAGGAAVAGGQLQRQRRRGDGRRVERLAEQHRDRGGERLVGGVGGRRHREHARRHRLHDDVERRHGTGDEVGHRALAALVERRMARLQAPVGAGVGGHGVAAGQRERSPVPSSSAVTRDTAMGLPLPLLTKPVTKPSGWCAREHEVEALRRHDAVERQRAGEVGRGDDALARRRAVAAGARDETRQRAAAVGRRLDQLGEDHARIGGSGGRGQRIRTRQTTASPREPASRPESSTRTAAMVS